MPDRLVLIHSAEDPGIFAANCDLSSIATGGHSLRKRRFCQRLPLSQITD